MLENKRIAVIGLGYVGLPLFVELSKKFETIGFDLSKKRIKELQNAKDSTNEVNSKDLSNLKDFFTENTNKLKDRNVYIVTVPTPIKKNKEPDLAPLQKACNTIGTFLDKEEKMKWIEKV